MANAVPLAPTLTGPDNNSYVAAGADAAAITFWWLFNDPGDTQSSSTLRFKKAGDAGWTTRAPQPYPWLTYGLPPSWLTVGYVYEWQILTVDSAGQASPWSASRFFTTVDTLPPPVITTPTGVGLFLDSSPLTVSWTIPAWATQDQYDVALFDPAYPGDVAHAFVHVHGEWYADAASPGVRTVQVDMPSGLVGQVIDLQVSYMFASNWARSALFRFTAAVKPPEVPLVVLAQVEGKPEVTVTVTNPPASDIYHLDTDSWDLTRDGVPIAKDQAPNSSFTDSFVGSGEVSYVVTSRTALGGTSTSF